MSLIWPNKDPEEVLDYVIDWSVRITDPDVITSSVWSIVTPPDAALVIGVNSFTVSSTTVWLSGGTLDASYMLLNHIVTSEGREMEQTVRLRIKAR